MDLCPHELAIYGCSVAPDDATATTGLQPDDGDHAGRLTWALQRAGDCVLLPPGAWHATLNLGEAVGYTRNVVDARCRGVKRAAALLGADDASLAGRLERVGRKRRA